MENTSLLCEHQVLPSPRPLTSVPSSLRRSPTKPNTKKLFAHLLPRDRSQQWLKSPIDGQASEDLIVETQQVSGDLSRCLPPANPLLQRTFIPPSEIHCIFTNPLQSTPQSALGHDSREVNKVVFPTSTPLKHQTVLRCMKDIKAMTLLEYHEQNRQNLVYERFKDASLSSCDSERERQSSRYFATILKSLKSMRKQKQLSNHSSTKGLLTSLEKPVQEQLPRSLGHLEFCSEFESGNLFAAYEIDPNNYELVLTNDINTKGNTQWFYFKVSNAKKGQKVNFTIINLVKSDSLFSQGLLPVRFSCKANAERGEEWVRDGFDVSYVRNSYLREVQFKGKERRFYSSIQFSFVFKHDDDVVYFAHSFPYLYSDWKSQLHAIINDPIKSTYVTHRILCQTLAGNTVDQLTITSPSGFGSERAQRKGVVLLARQHPGETNSSFVAKGIIEFLLSADPRAEYLRNTCVIKIIPMVNPDGVVHGNYRCNLAGVDLNRRWKKPKKALVPCVYAVKNAIQRMHQEREIKLVLDLHGHSQKMGSFFYGCSDKTSVMQSRIFPFLLSELNERVYFNESRFTFKPFQMSTARVALWKHLLTPNVFTFETSFYGYTQKNSVPVHFTRQDYCDLGKDILVNLFNILKEETSSASSIVQNTGDFQLNAASKLQEAVQKMAANQNLIDLGNLSDDGSDSNPSEDELSPEEKAFIFSLKKKRKIKISLKKSVRVPSPVNPATQPATSTQQLSQSGQSKRYLNEVSGSEPKRMSELVIQSSAYRVRTTEDTQSQPNAASSGYLRFQLSAANNQITGKKEISSSPMRPLSTFKFSTHEMKIYEDESPDHVHRVGSARKVIHDAHQIYAKNQQMCPLQQDEASVINKIARMNRVIRTASSKRFEALKIEQPQWRPIFNTLSQKGAGIKMPIQDMRIGHLMLGRSELSAFHADMAKMNEVDREYPVRKRELKQTNFTADFETDHSGNTTVDVIRVHQRNISVFERNHLLNIAAGVGILPKQSPAMTTEQPRQQMSQRPSSHRGILVKKHLAHQEIQSSSQKLINSNQIPSDPSCTPIPAQTINHKHTPSKNKTLLFCDSELPTPPLHSPKKQQSHRPVSSISRPESTSLLLPNISSATPRPNISRINANPRQRMISLKEPSAFSITNKSTNQSKSICGQQQFISGIPSSPSRPSKGEKMAIVAGDGSNTSNMKMNCLKDV